MFGCTIELDLSEYFCDIRKYSCIYIDFKQCKEIRDAENHIKRLFNIDEDICLVKTKSLSNDVCLFPSDENIRLLQSVYSTTKVKVLPAQSLFQPLRDSRNNDSLLSVITIKDENFGYKSEENEIELENTSQDEYYDAVRLEIEENECNQCNGKQELKAIRDMCDSSIQTELTFSETVAATGFSLHDKQSKTKEFKENTFTISKIKSDKSAHKKKNFILPEVILDTSQEYETDCEILDTNNSEEKCDRINEASFQDGELRTETNKERTYNEFTFMNSINEDCVKEQVKRKRKKGRHSFSNDLIIGELSESQSAKHQDKAVRFHLSEIKNSRKRKKAAGLDVGNSYAQNEFYSNDICDIEQLEDKQLSSDLLLQELTIKYSNDKQEMSNQEIDLNETEITQNNYNVKKNKKKIKKNEILNIKANTKHNRSDSTNYESNTDYSLSQPCSNKKSKEKQILSESPIDPLTALKNTFINEINLKLIELNKHEMVPNNKLDLLINRSTANKKYVDIDSSCVESEKMSTTLDSTHTLPNDCVDFPTTRRRRKRRHNTKAKAEKRAAAMKLIAEEFHKPDIVPTPIANFRRSNSHKFFSDDDFIDDMKPSEISAPHNFISTKESDFCHSSNGNHITVSNFNDTVQNSEFSFKENLKDSIENCKLVSAHHSQNVSLNKKAAFSDQGLSALFKKVKINKKVPVFEYIKSSNRSAPIEIMCTSEKDNTILTESKLPKKSISYDDIQSETVEDYKIPDCKNDEIVRVDEINKTTNDNNSKVIDVTNYPIINSVMENDIIIFKMLRLGPDYQPEISKQIIAKVISIDSKDTTKVLSLHVLRGVDEFKLPEGKFSLGEAESIDSEELLEIEWSDMIEPRLFYP